MNEWWCTANAGTTTGTLTSGAINLPAGTPTLTFWQWRQTEGGTSYDQSLVQVSADGGATWTLAYQSTDNSASWVQASVNLSTWAGKSVLLRFAFNTVDGTYNTYEGWYVDDPRINGAAIGCSRRRRPPAQARDPRDSEKVRAAREGAGAGESRGGRRRSGGGRGTG